MILESLFEFLSSYIDAIPFNLPDVPTEFQTILSMFFDGIHNAMGLVDVFIDLDFWLTCMVVMLILKNIKHIWNGVIWLLNIIPGVEIGYWN